MERTILKAKDGYIFTNGETYGETIYLAEDVDEKTFYEIPIEEYREIINSEEAGIEDYETSLSRFGVDVNE